MNADETFDVAVVGAGAAGLAAALSAARMGARVALVERSPAPGGVVTQALVHTICGLYRPAPDGHPEHLHPGFPSTFARLLEERGGTGAIGRSRDALFLQIEPTAFTALATDMCRTQSDLTLLDHCTVVKAVLADTHGDDSQLSVQAGGAERTLLAQAVIDTSGDATLAALGGARTLQASSEDLQYPSYIFRIDGADTQALDAMECARTSTAIARAAKQGHLPKTAEAVLLRPGVDPESVYVTINVDKPTDRSFDPLDASLLEQLATQSRLLASELTQFLVTERAPFAHARLGVRATHLGVRESRRVAGRRLITADDLRATGEEPDTVCSSSWPIELWTSHRHLRFEALDRVCPIPIGSLQSQSHPRLGMAGRCMSADHEALGALRVIATSMATGEAAGINAALAVDGSVALAGVEATTVRREIDRLAAKAWSI